MRRPDNYFFIGLGLVAMIIGFYTWAVWVIVTGMFDGGI